MSVLLPPDITIVGGGGGGPQPPLIVGVSQQAGMVVVDVQQAPTTGTYPIAALQLYRSTSPTGPFTQISSSPLSLTEITNALYDNVPMFGSVVYYQATASDSIGNISAPSAAVPFTALQPSSSFPVILCDPNEWGRRLRAVLPQSWFSSPALSPGGLVGPDPAKNGLAWAITQAFAAGFAYLFCDLIEYAQKQTRLVSATDVQLDEAAIDFFGTMAMAPGMALPRLSGETDAQYSAALRTEIGAAKITVAAITAALQRWFARSTYSNVPSNVFVCDQRTDPITSALYNIKPAGLKQLLIQFQYDIPASQNWYAGRTGYAGRTTYAAAIAYLPVGSGFFAGRNSYIGYRTFAWNPKAAIAFEQPATPTNTDPAAIARALAYKLAGINPLFANARFAT